MLNIAVTTSVGKRHGRIKIGIDLRIRHLGHHRGHDGGNIGHLRHITLTGEQLGSNGVIALLGKALNMS
nr:hypothetical protein [Paludibacterium denitrificans]